MACGVSSLGLNGPVSRTGNRARTAGTTSASSSQGLQSARDPAFEVGGTWDFKWPLGKTIRVAFQAPPSDEYDQEAFADAKEKVRSYAERWSKWLPPDSVQLLFDLPDLDPALGGKVSAADRHRSSFLPETPAAVPYDVLVSLADLPIQTTDRFRGRGHETEDILFPISELGSYARRADYGAPTIHLGRFGKYREQPLSKYFTSSILEHVVVHEFGHVLGLPHLHQHPGLIRPEVLSDTDVTLRIQQLDEARGKFFKSPPELIELFERLLGVGGTEETVMNHVVRAWRGNERFSDWVAFEANELEAHTDEAKLDSVMTVPYYECLRSGHPPCERCTQGSNEFVTHPTPRDGAMLARMYEVPRKLASNRSAAE